MGRNYHLSRFFVQGTWQKYFQVTQQDTERPEIAHDIVQRGSETLRRRNEAVEEAQRGREITVDPNRLRANAWIDHTAWPTHLSGFTLHELLQLIRPPIEADDEGRMVRGYDNEAEAEAEPELRQACRATERLVRKQYPGSTTYEIGRRNKYR